MPQESMLLQISDVKKYYPITMGLFRREVGIVKAVDGVDLEIGRGETLGLVGESGCGKSTLGRVILDLEPPTEGRVIFDGQDLSTLKRRKTASVQEAHADHIPGPVLFA